ncbi:MAG: GTP 3',8-cyclase MoaA [Bacteroidales bacterium]|nr:GTP 3',8-cyclase MoaA [Bacteroidales bacterium]
MIIDKHGRPMNYLRVAVTDRCNLRCTYCMPHENMQFLPKNEILSYEELLRIITVFTELGVNKVRFTGGEPFFRKDFIDLLEYTSQLEGIDSVNITTNGVLTQPYIDKLKKIKDLKLNISLDTLVAEKFIKITRRNAFETVMKTINDAMENGIQTKINMVVMDGVNTNEIIDFVEYFRKTPVNLRFIEQMPFNEHENFKSVWTVDKISNLLSENYNVVQQPIQPQSTTIDYKIDSSDFVIGIIAGFSRSFCGTCNRIRLTSTGRIKTCLYADPGLDVRALIRSGSNDAEIKERLIEAIQQRHKNGFEAEEQRSKQVFESMSKIGG